MKEKSILHFIVFILMITLSLEIYAQMPANLANKPKGKLVGELIYQGRDGTIEKAAGRKVALMVFFKGQRVLMLDKDTDQEGRFEFSNVFKDPDYQYAVGAIFEDKLFVYPNITMPNDKEEIKIEFLIGENSPYKISEDITNQARKIATGEINQPMSSNSENQIQPTVLLSRSQAKNLTIILSVLILFLAIFYSFNKKES
jgi:hypothetical protein